MTFSSFKNVTKNQKTIVQRVEVQGTWRRGRPRTFNEVARKDITDCRVPRTWFYMGWAKKV